MKRNGDFVEQAVLRHQKIILSVDHGVPKDVVEDGRRDETRAVDHPLFSQGFLHDSGHPGVVDHREREIEAADSQSHPIPHGPTSVMFGACRGHQQASQEGGGVQRVGHRDGSPCDPLVAEGGEDLGAVGGEAVQHDVGRESPKKQQHPTFQVGVGLDPVSTEVPSLAMPPPQPSGQGDVQGHRKPAARRKNLGEEIDHKANDDGSCSLGHHGDVTMVWAAVEAMCGPTKHHRTQHTGQDRMADAPVKCQVVEFVQEILPQHVHIGEGACHSSPDHGSVPQALAQHSFSHRRTQHDL